MSRRVVVLRPEPGDAETAARLEALGLNVLRLPLFTVVPVPWRVPVIESIDALLISSANAIRHGGVYLNALKPLPVVAVGWATARAAQEAGFTVALFGDRDAAAAVDAARVAGFARLLHLGGRDRMTVTDQSITVYESNPVGISPEAITALTGTVALLHSARAARRFSALIGTVRASVRTAAISPAVAAAAGSGWETILPAAVPTDAALVALAATLAH